MVTFVVQHFKSLMNHVILLQVQLILGYRSALGIMEKLAALRIENFGTFALTTVFSLIFEFVRRCVVAVLYKRKMDNEARKKLEGFPVDDNPLHKDTNRPLIMQKSKKIIPIQEDEEMAFESSSTSLIAEGSKSITYHGGPSQMNNKSKSNPTYNAYSNLNFLNSYLGFNSLAIDSAKIQESISRGKYI